MESNQPPRKVFIVDDDKDLLTMYSFKFKEKNFEVIEAYGSADALDKFREGIAPDIVVLDVVMPNMDGFELLARVKSENLVQNSKIVMLSNLGQAEDVEKSRKLGANGYIIKASATPAEVVEKVSTILSGQELFAVVD
jgi:DNA-binding response OmpR family regulator